jgi:hypothetical protein
MTRSLAELYFASGVPPVLWMFDRALPCGSVNPAMPLRLE